MTVLSALGYKHLKSTAATATTLDVFDTPTYDITSLDEMIIYAKSSIVFHKKTAT